MKRVVLLRSNAVNPDPPVEKVADTLLANGFDVTIVAWDRDSKEKVKEDKLHLQCGNAKIVRFGIPAVFGGGLKKTFKQFFTFQKRLFSWLKKNSMEYDIIHAFDFDTGFIANKIAKKYKKKLVYHILDFYVDSHGFSEGFSRNVIKKAEIGVINRADCTVICTEKRKEQIKGSHPKTLIIVHNTPKLTDDIQGDMVSADSHERCRIVYVGILAGSRFLKETISLVKQDERYEFHVGGFGKMENEIIQEAKNCERITYYGKLPYNKTLALESSCDIMIAIYDPKVPNHKYAAPNKFYESLMVGKPIVMAKNTGFDEIIEKNNIGVLIDYNEDGFKCGMKKLLEQKNEWKQMSERMKKLYKDEYSWDKMENRLMDIYRNL